MYTEGIPESDWPEDVGAVYEELNQEDCRLAELFFPTIEETWPSGQ